MDPDKKPVSSSNEPTDGASSTGHEVDESHAAAILNAAAASKSDTSQGGPNPGDFSPETSASPSGSRPSMGAPSPTASSAAPMPGAAPVPSSNPVPDSPTPNMGDSASVLGAAPVGMVAPKRGKKPMIIALIVVVLVLVILGGVAAAYYQVMNKPQNVLNTALQNSFSPTKAGSQDFEGSLDVKPKDSTTISTTFTGAADVKTGAFSLNAKLDASITTIKLDMLSADGSTLYLRVSGLEGVASLLGLGSTGAGSSSDDLSFIAPLIAGLNNQWLEINPSMVKQLTGTDSNLTTKLSADDLKKLGDAYKKNQFLTVSKSLKDEAIKGKSSKHYQVVVDKTALKNFMAAVKAANISALKFTGDDITSFNKAIDKMDFSKYPVDVWISKSDKMIDQVSFSASSNGTTVSVRYTVDDYGKPVKVEAPTGAKSLLDVLSGLLGGGASSDGLDSLTGGSGISL